MDSRWARYAGWLLLGMLISWTGIGAAPVPADTAALDTARLLSDQPVKSPMGAVLRSALLPGWGQVYNEQYTKAGIAFGLNAYFIYKIMDFHQQWRQTHDQGFRDRRNLYTWYFGAAYALTLLDAYVDAYLYGFDRAMEIGVLPSVQPENRFLMWTVKVRF